MQCRPSQWHDAALPTSPPALDVERLALALYRNDYPGTECGSGRDWPDYPNGTTHDWYLETAEPIAAEYARLAEQPKEPQP